MNSDIDTTPPVFTALNTLRASRLTVRLAMIFGKKSIAYDSGCMVTMHRWRGKWYLTDCTDDTRSEQK